MIARVFAPWRIIRNWGINHIVALYVLIGSGWILLSDQLFVFNAPDHATATLFGTAKGLGYVIVTAGLLHWLISRYTARLRASESQFRTLYQSMRQGVFYQGADGTLLEANPAALEMFGLSEAEFTGRTSDDQAWQVIREDGTTAPSDEYPSIVALRTGQPVLDTVLGVVNPRLQAIKWLSINAIPEFRNGWRTPQRVAVTLHDVTELKRAEEQLRESEERFRSLVEQSPVSTQVLSPDGWTVQVNRAFEKLWGITLTDMKGYNLLADQQLVSLGLMPYIQRAFSGEVASIPAAEYNTRESLGVGAKKWVQANIYPVKDEAGTIRQVILMHENITEHRLAEEALRESEVRYRRLVETSPDSIFLHQAGCLVFVNPAGCRLLGASAGEQLIGRSIFNFIHPDYHPIVTERIRQAMTTGQLMPVVEEKFVRLDGSPLEVEVATSALPINGQPTVQVIARDVTERKRRDREFMAIATIATALRTAATRDEMIPVIVQQVANLLKAEGAALIRHEPTTGEAVIVYGLGVGADSIGLRIPPGAGIVGHVIATGQPYVTQDAEHDPHVFRPDLANELHALVCAPLIAHSQIIGVLWAGSLVSITDEEARLLVAIADIAANALHRAEVLETLEQHVYDRTRELAEANERLKELDRLKSKFVSDVSHELRTPITSLMLNVELLEHGKPEKREHYLSVIRQQTARQVQLIEDILNLSRLELSATKTQFAPVKINALIEQAVHVYRSSAEAANLHLEFAVDPAEPVVQGVEGHLSQVVTNLIANAINYTPAGFVKVSTRVVDREVAIEVRDSGLGIAPEDMPHLFDRFYRGKLTWQVRGSGLGLAIVKEITEVHHGRVEVDSQAGVGSTFRVYLPVI